ncbi:MAG: sugar ABC transporter ATP-binding protein, partial [Spirochaetales bacterium]|nr:sugar ABC transporter ATP-binding protein [Spirochaetales bacterium]
VGAKYEIYKLINELASSGKCIIVFSNEYPEIFQIADKTLVMYKGQIQSIINRSELTETRVMALSTGIKEEK